MEDAKAKLLQEADWEDIAVRLGKYIFTLTSNRCLPLGHTPEDIIQEAVTRLVSRARAWNPDTQPLFTHLKWIVKSILSEKGYYGKAKRDPLRNAENDEVLAQFPGERNSGEEDLDEAGLKWKALEKEIADDQELQDYVSAIRLGADGPKAIAELSGIPIQRVYELPRKLNKVLPAIQKTYETLMKTGALP